MELNVKSCVLILTALPKSIAILSMYLIINRGLPVITLRSLKKAAVIM